MTDLTIYRFNIFVGAQILRWSRRTLSRLEEMIFCPQDMATRKARTEHLRDALERRIFSLHGTCRPLILKGPIAVRPWAEIFYARGGTYATPVGVKLFLDPATGAPSAEAAHSAFTSLTRAFAMASHIPQPLVVQPYDLFADLGVVVMEWIDGASLRTHVNRSARPESLWTTREAGIWLAKFHDCGGLSRGALNTAKTLSILDEEIEGNPKALSERTVAKAIEIIRRTAESVESEDTVLATTCGDFKPDNLMVTRQGLIGIDVDLDHVGPVVAEAAHFLNHLALQFYTPRGLLRAVHQHKFERAFIDGYEEYGGTRLAMNRLMWRRLNNAVRLHLIRQSWGTSLRSTVSGLQLRYLIQRLSAEMIAI